jgi:hypothetical protein
MRARRAHPVRKAEPAQFQDNTITIRVDRSEPGRHSPATRARRAPDITATKAWMAGHQGVYARP